MADVLASILFSLIKLLWCRTLRGKPALSHITVIDRKKSKPYPLRPQGQLYFVGLRPHLRVTGGHSGGSWVLRPDRIFSHVETLQAETNRKHDTLIAGSTLASTTWQEWRLWVGIQKQAALSTAHGVSVPGSVWEVGFFTKEQKCRHVIRSPFIGFSRCPFPEQITSIYLIQLSSGSTGL